jgi:hypothetical protein
MKKLTISNIDENTVVLSQEAAVQLLKDVGMYEFLKVYDVDEKFILKNIHLVDQKDLNMLVSSGINISQQVIEVFIETNKLELKDIHELSMKVYSNLDSDFIDKYNKYINWEKMIVYLSSSDKLDIEKYIDIIEEKDMWNIISTTELPIEFIREYKDKLKWNVVSLINDFTDEEKIEFDDYLLKEGSIDIVDNTVNLDTKDIVETFKASGVYEKRETIKNTEQLSPDEIKKLKELLKIIK